MRNVLADRIHRFWIVLDQGKLSEYSNWKQRLDLHMEPIDLRVASVREARNAERRFCFEVITPQFKRVYQATSEEDMNSWINAVNNALQSAFEGHTPFTPQSKTDSAGRDIGSALTGKSSSYHGHHTPQYQSPTNQSVNRRTTVGARPNYTRTGSNSFDENPSKLLETIRSADQGNAWCADCGSTSKVEWVSINLGIVLCIECSGIHRSLGTHISKIRSLTLDINSFSTDIVELILQVGNRVSNMIWEAQLDRAAHIPKPSPASTRDQRLKFITAKYADKVFVQPISTTLSHYSTADETLLASVKKNDLQGVLYAIALSANTNAHDRSRNTHCLFLALAAADPASPSAGTSPANSPRTKTDPSKGKVVSFPIAELLVQNGAEIPTKPAPFPLGASAQLYIDQRTGRGTDQLTALPKINNRSSMMNPSSGGMGSVLGTPTPGPEKEKDRERLQKRGSAGSRFAGKVAGIVADR